MSNAVILLAGFGILLIVAVWLAGIYNRLVALKNGVANAYAQIDVQLRRRHDLIPNLVAVASKYMGHERGTLEAVVAARGKAMQARTAAAGNPADAATIATLNAAERVLGGSMARLFAVSESYPDLKASANMAQLAEELTSTENRVAFTRQAFNDAVMDLNTGIGSFPAVLFAPALGFQAAGILEAIDAPEQRRALAVQF